MDYMQLVQHLTPYLVDTLTSNLANIGSVSDLSQFWIGHLSVDWMNLLHPGTVPDWAVLAQQFETDVFASTRRAVGAFVASGKLWVLLIGIAIGYILKSVTSYG